MRVLVGLGILGGVILAFASAHAVAPDQESAQIMCDLTGDCADPGSNSAGNAASAPAPVNSPVNSGARTSTTRGFTFQRATSGGTAGSAPIQQTPIQQAAVQCPAQPGAADLKVSFMPNSSVLTDPAKARLAKFAAVLASPKLAARRLRIEGHTDASGSFRANIELSRRRAQSVADYLAASGIEKSRIDVIGYGSSRPLPGASPSDPNNRRVMAVLL